MDMLCPKSTLMLSLLLLVRLIGMLTWLLVGQLVGQD